MTEDTCPAAGPRRTRRTTGSYRAADARRAAILEAASQLFAEHGFHDTSVTAVATAAGTSQTGLLHHFRDKDTLLLAVLRWHDHAQAAQFSDPRLGIRVLLGHVLHVLAEEEASPGLTRLYAVTAAEATTPGHPAHGYFRNRFRLMEDNNAQAVQASIDRGELRPGLDATVVSRCLIALSDGLKLQWLTSPSFDLVEHARAHYDALLKGITADGSGLSRLTSEARLGGAGDESPLA